MGGECGWYFNDNNLIRIIGGKEAVPYSWPSMVRFFSVIDFRGNLTTGNGFCAGTLINQDTVISAAHCFYKPNANVNTRAKVGIHSLYEGLPLKIKSILLVSLKVN